MTSKRHHAPLSEIALRVKAVEQLLIEKGLVEEATLDHIVEIFETRVGPHVGARLVARAWTDPDFRERLLADATAVLGEMELTGLQGETVVAVANTPEVHNVVVCTLCSCYPWPLLGLPPTWYKSPAYRSRVVRDPRGVFREFGFALGDDVEVRVWDSSAEVRYIVLPMRPEGSEGLDIDALAGLVTRDGMLGTAPL